MNRAGLMLASAACFLCAGLGVLAIYSESAAFSYGVQGNPKVYDKIEANQVRLGYSYYSKKRLLVHCMDGMSSQTFELRGPERTWPVALNCQDLASQILADSPLDSLAWAVAAKAASMLRDFDGMNSRLASSWVAAPNEQWLSTIRMNIVEFNYDHTNEVVRANHLKDLAVIALSRDEIETIAKYYWEYPAFRERVTAAVSVLPDEAQMRFLAYIRRAGNK